MVEVRPAAWGIHFARITSRPFIPMRPADPRVRGRLLAASAATVDGGRSTADPLGLLDEISPGSRSPGRVDHRRDGSSDATANADLDGIPEESRA